MSFSTGTYSRVLRFFLFCTEFAGRQPHLWSSWKELGLDVSEVCGLWCIQCSTPSPSPEQNQRNSSNQRTRQPMAFLVISTEFHAIMLSLSFFLLSPSLVSLSTPTLTEGYHDLVVVELLFTSIVTMMISFAFMCVFLFPVK
ncbi:hypothetical protein F5878DRAFT_369358 [Lentinula raphanica]|uniref:Uncharacterized protein n=1 Tax=Lentinula raphanica TaxID=153919 RepID=A0AA38UDI8_9AGAR|nr:hypothetical protein F5878DRAFT_369358 [Lentinula raphanica]